MTKDDAMELANVAQGVLNDLMAAGPSSIKAEIRLSEDGEARVLLLLGSPADGEGRVVPETIELGVALFADPQFLQERMRGLLRDFAARFSG